MPQRRLAKAFLFLLPILSTRAAPNNPFSRRNSHNGGRIPEVPSTLLKLHQIYTSHPPHDTSLYQTLRVSPNATSIEIQKSYRKLSRQYHPDKQRHKHKANREDAARELEKIQKAYRILKEDDKRLLYHRYGLQDVSTAVLLLTGYQGSPKIPTPQEVELLHLMGFHRYPQPQPDPPPPPLLSGPPNPPPIITLDQQQLQQERIQFLAATILERIRPLVEETLSPATVADFIATECDRLKRLPLGANILRCVGRAYRHAGQRYLRRQQRQASKPFLPLRDSWHDAKHVATALVASGRVALKENWLLKTTKRQQQQQQQQKVGNKNNPKPAIAYHQWEGGMLDDIVLEGDDDDDVSSSDAEDANEELQQQELLKSEKVMMELLQVEALWKVHKIGLNRAVKEACELILSGNYFFFSQEGQQPPYPADGWVSSSSSGSRTPSSVIHVHEGRVRAASALVLIGDTMVQMSKEGTAWME